MDSLRRRTLEHAARLANNCWWRFHLRHRWWRRWRWSRWRWSRWRWSRCWSWRRRGRRCRSRYDRKCVSTFWGRCCDGSNLVGAPTSRQPKEAVRQRQRHRRAAEFVLHAACSNTSNLLIASLRGIGIRMLLACRCSEIGSQVPFRQLSFHMLIPCTSTVWRSRYQHARTLSKPAFSLILLRTMFLR